MQRSRLFAKSFVRSGLAAAALVALGAGTLAGCDSGGSGGLTPGQTDFETDDPIGGAAPGRGATDSAGGAPTAGGATTGNGSQTPMGRTGTVEEADIYRIDQNRLFYLNTYRGFLIYDVNDTKNPKMVSRLPVYGYPVEMFVSGTTVYALLRDVLYMTQVNGKAQFERRDVSQMVVIDVADIANPRVVQTIDIVGQLREGVSRKIDDTVYVVSYIPQYYYWGWRYELPNPSTEQAWVYSFNVANPTNIQLVQKLKIFEGGSISDQDPVTGGYVSRSFSDVALSATSNTLMVVENWYLSSWTPGETTNNGTWTCGSYAGDQRAVVSIIDISDPTGVIALHAHFQTRGSLGDQFKQTYVYDDANKTGTYYGIFARQAWSSSDCSGQSYIQNTFESWDVTNRGAPSRLSSLAFGKPNETVRGSTFDPTRKVAYAVTAQSIDPLYVLSFADRANLAIRSQIDGLSGDMTLFRLVEGNQYLIGIGRDTSETCSGFQGNETRHGIGMAVSLIDVRDLDGIKLMQRQCVAVDGDWVSSEISWNLDQAHKMIGMLSDGTTNVITVPVSYSKRTQDDSWWWYKWETAVGIMSWDVNAYDAAKAPTDQTVIKNYGTFVHPDGEVRRSIVFTHAGDNRRTMINLSDTYVSVADIQDLANPTLLANVEVAPYVSQIFTFGDYVVEAVPDAPYGWSPDQGLTDFRIKKAGGALDEAPILSRFSVAQSRTAIKMGDKLIVFRLEVQDAKSGTATTPVTDVLVFDMANPLLPKLVGKTQMANYFYPYYPFFCGVGMGYWYWYGAPAWVATDNAIVSLQWVWDSATSTSATHLVTIDLTDPTQPAVLDQVAPTRGAKSYTAGLMADTGNGSGFFLTSYDWVESVNNNGIYINRSRYYAERFHRNGTTWAGEGAVNLPGNLVRTWTSPAGERLYLTSDYINYQAKDTMGNSYWRYDTRLNLLRGTTKVGKAVAELRDSHRFTEQYVGDLAIDGDTLFANVSPVYPYYYYGVGVGGGVAVDSVGATVPTSAGAGSATVSALTASSTSVALDDVSDRLVVFDLGKLSFRTLYDQATGTQGVQFMGTSKGQLFESLSGEGILALDVSDPAHPIGRQFMRTLGWATHVAFAGDNVYVASGYFGTYRMDLTAPGNL